MRASKEHRARERWCRQAARLVAEAMGPCPACKGAGVEWSGVEHLGAREYLPCDSCNGLGHRVTGERGAFDVSAVRAYCERLVAEGERRAEERVVFIDWCRDFGAAPGGRHSGPCNRHGPTSHRCDRGTPGCILRHAERGGWPLDLAGLWRARGLGSASVAVGPNIARTAQRLLDTLDGRCPWAPSAGAQAIACEAASCERGKVDVGYHATTYRSREDCQRDCDALKRLHLAQRMAEVERITHREPRQHGDVWRIHDFRDCPDCRGTGHNLAGALPGVEVSAQRRRWLSDAAAHVDVPEQIDPRQGHAIGELESESHEWDLFAVAGGRWEWSESTRDVPRGQHRQPEAGYEVDPRSLVEGYEPDERPPLDHRINGRCWDARPIQFGGDVSRMPRWRRGELRHAEQRRERDR